jgi:hypothetical protein
MFDPKIAERKNNDQNRPKNPPWGVPYGKSGFFESRPKNPQPISKHPDLREYKSKDGKAEILYSGDLPCVNGVIPLEVPCFDILTKVH